MLDPHPNLTDVLALFQGRVLEEDEDEGAPGPWDHVTPETFARREELERGLDELEDEWRREGRSNA